MSERSSSPDHRADDRLHWEQLGASYHEGWQKPAKQRLSNQELELIGRHLPRTGVTNALDVGMGNGRILDFLLSRSADTTFRGIDFAQSMVDVCQARFAGEPRVAELTRCDIGQEPVPFDVPFDFISAIRVLKYDPDWTGALERLVSRLEPGGTLVFSMPNRLSINRFSKPYAVPWYMTTPGELRRRLEALGTSVVEMRAFPRLPYAAYERARGWAITSLLTADRVLAACCGPTFLGREIFVAARKA